MILIPGITLWIFQTDLKGFRAQDRRPGKETATWPLQGYNPKPETLDPETRRGICWIQSLQPKLEPYTNHRYEAGPCGSSTLRAHALSEALDILAGL